MIVMAVIDENGILTDVFGIKDKSRAVNDEGNFSTIITASEGNKKEAEDVLLKECNNTAIRVLNVKSDHKTLEELVKETEKVISARIDRYNPNELMTVVADSPFKVYMTVTNTGNTAWQFIAEADVFDSDGRENIIPRKPVNLNPDQQIEIELSYVIHKPGNYWLQFYIWKGKTPNNENLLDRQPTPSKHLITVLPAQAKRRSKKSDTK